MAYQEIIVEVRNRIATITLNRPQHLNAWTDVMAEEVYAAMWAASADENVRVIVLTGAGRAFCAGGDITGFKTTNPRQLIDKLPRAYDFSRRPDYQSRAAYFPAIQKPIIAMLNGATAILRALCIVAPGHPVARSFSAAYWRGGDAAVEGVLFRPQFFDKLVAWGGESALKSAKNYIGPGFELVAFDPKTSISSASSRFQFIEGSVADVDRYCERLQRRLGIERMTCSATQGALPGEVSEEIDGIRKMEPYFRVWGNYQGAGVPFGVPRYAQRTTLLGDYGHGRYLDAARARTDVGATLVD